MFSFTETELREIVVHHVGNKQNDESLDISKNTLSLDETVVQLLEQYFLMPFKDDKFYQFFHDSDISQNAVYHYISQIFDTPGSFYDNSVKIAEHLYEKSEHPKIKAGELYIAYFNNCLLDDELVDAIGIFKSENHETYLKVYQKDDMLEIEYDNGININKLDKGCLVFNSEKNGGYVVSIVDTVKKSGEAQFWKDDFLQLKQRSDNYYHTQNYLDVCKGFVTDVYNEENEVEKPDQAELLNKTVKYFNEKETFNQDDFEQEVMMGESGVIQAFGDYKEKYQQDREVELDEDFEISKNAVKNEKRKFKSVLKLDKNFHVYIHGDRERIVKGFDTEKGLNFYQIFFEQEK